jgi:hypothetical protein
MIVAAGLLWYDAEHNSNCQCISKLVDIEIQKNYPKQWCHFRWKKTHSAYAKPNVRPKPKCIKVPSIRLATDDLLPDIVNPTRICKSSYQDANDALIDVANAERWTNFAFLRMSVKANWWKKDSLNFGQRTAPTSVGHYSATWNWVSNYCAPKASTQRKTMTILKKHLNVQTWFTVE